MNFSHDITFSLMYAYRMNKYRGSKDNETILFMAQYAHLSEPDPQWLATAPSVIPHLYSDDIVELRNLFTSLWNETNRKIVVEVTPQRMYHMPINHS